jgi:hypothetical protein
VDTHYDPDRETSHGPGVVTPAQEVLRYVLGRVGADVSVHQAIVQAQQEAESIQHLAAEYLTIAKAAQAHRWADLIAASGLILRQVDEVLASEAYGPLVAALRTAESRGLDVDTAVPMLVAAGGFGDAEDIASVLHHRVDKWTQTAPPSRRVRDRSVAGLIARPHAVTDPDMRRALDERAEAMERRAVYVVQRSLERGEWWIGQLGQPPADPARRVDWYRAAMTVATYRELYSGSEMSPETATSATQAGDARIARTAADWARQLAEQDQNRQTQQATSEPVQVPQVMSSEGIER